jgi:ABC-2 type transport system permease protein
LTVRPYFALFSTQFQLGLQYRAAAVAGFATQLWWGAIKVMILAAFFAAGAGADAPMTLAQAITYVWLAQAFLTLQPWFGDVAVSSAVRTGNVGIERVRPIDLYTWWYARSAATLLAKAVPRSILLILFSAVALPLLGLDDWALGAPPNPQATLLFGVSLALVVFLAAAVQMLLHVLIVHNLTDRGANLLMTPLIIFFSGSEVPLPLLPDWMQTFLFVQPLAGICDIPFRIYSGNLTGEMALLGLALQCFWIVVLSAVGRVSLERVMRRLEVQGG